MVQFFVRAASVTITLSAGITWTPTAQELWALLGGGSATPTRTYGHILCEAFARSSNVGAAWRRPSLVSYARAFGCMAALARAPYRLPGHLGGWLGILVFLLKQLPKPTLLDHRHAKLCCRGCGITAAWSRTLALLIAFSPEELLFPQRRKSLGQAVSADTAGPGVESGAFAFRSVSGKTGTAGVLRTATLTRSSMRFLRPLRPSNPCCFYLSSKGNGERF